MRVLTSKIMRYRLAAAVLLLVTCLPDPAAAQRGGRRVATLDGLAEHAGFYHLEEIILQADAIGENVLTYLVDERNRLLVLDVPPPLEGTTERVEIIGTFYDAGRLEPDDPRASGLPIASLAQSLLSKPWPGVGELPLLVATSSRPLESTDAVTLRTVALDPVRYLDDGVTLTGRFRGRNLYGDLPDSPGESRYDFVLASADAAVWVVGREPKGDGFELDVQARRDTGRWLQVTGTVWVHEGMVILDAGAIRLAEPETDAAPVRRAERRQGPPPEVIFSTPLDGDTDVPTDTLIRVQFSRDMAADSFAAGIEVTYPNPVAGTARRGPGHRVRDRVPGAQPAPRDPLHRAAGRVRRAAHLAERLDHVERRCPARAVVARLLHRSVGDRSTSDSSPSGP